ncbi:unnamed protein product [Brachionus calyciflorus]|uniref:Uncharacterized protein n=1 Tax=Brachionus calyciflorus TaxID=104777 RepID=A0A813Q9R1_9BILA|nr:unnamed protein product [Brachionus calyciflorus]
MKEDILQNDLVLCGTVTQKVDTMRYLGTEQDALDKVDKHINKLKQKTIAALAKLNSIGINSMFLCPFMKAQLFKIFLRPVLYYGLENIYINKTTMNQLKRLDGNALKRIFDLHKRCKTTNLQIALNIPSCVDTIKKIKIDLLARLLENEYAKKIIQETILVAIEKDLVTEVIKILEEENESLINEQKNITLLEMFLKLNGNQRKVKV